MASREPPEPPSLDQDANPSLPPVPAAVPVPPVASSSAPSLKALGKRRQHSPPTPLVMAAASIPKLKTEEAEKRVTRSSLGGAGDVLGDGSGLAGWNPELPFDTPIWLTRVVPANLTHHPPPTQVEPLPVPASTAKPTFRLLDVGDTFARSRHAGASETDTSDAYYHRLHRFPEILEKRSARLERDRLIHERAKLITELEELRGRGWVYIGAQGGRGEEERKRKIREGEERLKRYDYLLPNQPRKSGMLNVGAHPPPGPASTASDSRAGSPAAVSQPVVAARARHSTPLSASGDGGMTIRIKFGSKPVAASHSAAWAPAKQPAPPRFAGRGPARTGKRAKYADDDEEDESVDSDEKEEDTHMHGLVPQKPPSQYRKRDRKAEKERAAERVRLGLPARGKLSADILPLTTQTNAVSMDIDPNASVTHRPGLGEAVGPSGARANGYHPNSSASTTRSPHINKRMLRNSFFDSEALRLSVLASSDAKGGRRSSGRVSYAFGQRLVDWSFPRREFELHGGVDSEDENGSDVRLEDMVRDRLERLGAAVGGRPTLVNGVAVPSSALAVLTQPRQPLVNPNVGAPLLPAPPSPELLLPESERLPLVVPIQAPPSLVAPPHLLPVMLTVGNPAGGHGHGTRGIKKSIVSKGAQLAFRVDS